MGTQEKPVFQTHTHKKQDINQDNTSSEIEKCSKIGKFYHEESDQPISQPGAPGQISAVSVS